MARPHEPPFNPNKCHTFDRQLLIQEMTALSHAENWDEAKLELDFSDAYEDANMTHCRCGHGIMERCVLHNRITECIALVGNKCVKRFISHIALAAPAYAIFASIKRVRKDIDKTVHKYIVKLAMAKGRITARAE